MRWNLVGAFIRNNPFGTEIAFWKGLQRIGEEVTVVDPSYENQRFDENADVTLIFKWLDPGPYRDIVGRIGGRKVVYQVDDLRFPHIRDMMQKMREVCDHALTFDDDGSRLALQYGYRTGHRLLLTADDQLYRPMENVEKVYDACFVGSLTGGSSHASRVKMLMLLKRAGWNVVFANELFDIEKIRELYSQSWVVLNHATDVGQPFGHGYGYQCRHFEAGFTKSCILTNTVDNDSTLKNIWQFESEDGLLKSMKHLMDNVHVTLSFSQGLYEELMDSHRPEHRARELVRYVEGLA